MTVSAMLELTPDIFIHAILCGFVNMKIARQIKPSFTLLASVIISFEEKRYKDVGESKRTRYCNILHSGFRSRYPFTKMEITQCRTEPKTLA